MESHRAYKHVADHLTANGYHVCRDWKISGSGMTVWTGPSIYGKLIVDILINGGYVQLFKVMEDNCTLEVTISLGDPDFNTLIVEIVERFIDEDGLRKHIEEVKEEQNSLHYGVRER